MPSGRAIDNPRPPATPSPTPGLIPGTIHGTVRDDAGTPSPGARIRFGGPPCGFCWTASSDVHGEYFIADLPPGDYTLTAEATGFATEYWTSTGGSADSADAELIHLPPDDWLEGIDFTLSSLPVIQGRVTDSQGNAIEGASIGASTAAGYWAGNAESDVAGFYTLVHRHRVPSNSPSRLTASLTLKVTQCSWVLARSSPVSTSR